MSQWRKKLERTVGDRADCHRILVCKIPSCRSFRKSSFVATPWKNGGGITHEAIRVPASSDPFRWRVSVAHVDASGPFLELSEYNRKIVLLRGAGIELRFADRTRKTLRKSGDLAEFDGALATYWELLNAPV
jgi:uncharacterized protein